MATPPEILSVMVAAANLPPERFVVDHLFTMPPYAYARAPTKYGDFQKELALLLTVDINDICLIGSARTGFSLNRDHLLKRFGRQSDLDFIVVSSANFDACWDELVIKSEEFTLVGEEERRRLKKTQENFFGGYLRADQLPLGSTLSKEWFPRLAGPFACPVARLYPVKAWLFKSWTHARECYKNHVAIIQPSINKLLRLRGES